MSSRPSQKTRRGERHGERRVQARQPQPPRTSGRPQTRGSQPACQVWAKQPATQNHKTFEADVDWGGSDSEVSSDSCTTTCAMEGEVPRPEMGARQPRIPSYKPRRQASLGAQRPRTPSRSPQRQPVRLVPNQRWREVQQVQAHMARRRHAPHTRTTSSERDGGI